MPKETFFNLSEEKRQRIVEATYDAFIAKPYEDVAILDITTRAQIPVGSFYRYFQDKDDLYLHLFSKLEFRILDILNEKYSDFLFTDSHFDLHDIFSEKELLFENTWFKVPISVMQKFYFGAYDTNLIDYYRDKFASMFIQGEIREGIDPEFALFLFVTSTFNVYMYCYKYNITDPVKMRAIKDCFFTKIFPYGIFKNPSFEEPKSDKNQIDK